MVLVLARAAALVAVGVGLGFLVNAVRPGGISLGSFAVATSCTAPVAARAPEVLPPAEAITLCGDPGVVVADVRGADRFALGHVAGAVHLPCTASGDAANRALGALADKHTLIVYGDSTAEPGSVVESLRQRLPNPAMRVIILEGGFAAWDRAGLACSSGPCADCKQQHASGEP
jgi:rhodanese-related sulfurtransferase